MLLKDALAGTLRAARAQRGVDYEHLADATHRTYVGMLEQARANPTLEKLSEIGAALDLDLVTIVALAVSARKNELPSTTLQRVADEVQDFERNGGLKLLAEQFKDGQLVKRPQGKPRQPKNARAIQELRKQGFDRKEAAAKLGLAPSTISKYWHQGDY